MGVHRTFGFHEILVFVYDDHRLAVCAYPIEIADEVSESRITTAVCASEFGDLGMKIIQAGIQVSG